MKERERRKNKEKVLKFLEKLPSNRKVYYRMGNLMVEVTREEAIELIKKENEQ